MTPVHDSPFAGYWYPAEEPELDELLNRLFEDSRRRTGPYVMPQALAMVVPHAAPQYSGVVAAAAYRHVQLARPDRAFILGFSHCGRRPGVAIPAVERYRTPLGEVPIDVSAGRTLCSSPPFRLVDESDVCDHSVEIQLPFLQQAARNASVVPLYVGQLNRVERTDAAEALARMWRPRDILIASSDLTHYGRDFQYVPFPLDDRIATRLRALDHSVIAAASSVDSELFLRVLCRSGATACGSGPIALLLKTLSIIGGEHIYQQELDYRTSGEITGDFHESVSYGALAYFQQRSFELNETERHELLLSAHATLRRLSESGLREIVPARRLRSLTRRAPVFVTVRQAGRRLGCVGRLFNCLPLYDAVPQMLLGAMLDDPRLSPAATIAVDTEIEISVLTPMKLVHGTDAVRVGKHGVYVECGAHRAVLLPQAAGDAWTATSFVGHLFKKAGLGGDASGASDLRLYVFEAQVFSD